MPKPRVEVKVKGVTELQRNLRRIQKKAPEKFRAALYTAAERIMTDSKKLCPVAPEFGGSLRQSGHVVMPDRAKLEVFLGYGGPAGIGNVQGESNDEEVGYAVVQHEELSYRHTTGEAKYLEKAVRAAVPDLAEEIAKDCDLEKL